MKAEATDVARITTTTEMSVRIVLRIIRALTTTTAKTVSSAITANARIVRVIIMRKVESNVRTVRALTMRKVENNARIARVITVDSKTITAIVRSIVRGSTMKIKEVMVARKEEDIVRVLPIITRTPSTARRNR